MSLPSTITSRAVASQRQRDGLANQIRRLPEWLRVPVQMVSGRELGPNAGECDCVEWASYRTQELPIRAGEVILFADGAIAQDARCAFWLIATDPIAIGMGGGRGLVKVLERKGWMFYRRP